MAQLPKGPDGPNVNCHTFQSGSSMMGATQEADY
ncbi:uncharacterized protein METZ01_LOCUS12701 [marine metagenome]|jgi:hypothetical protein|uniref:Uncharacterized protein n=1 Tax=marine metagenome TaxID=408172 RepID=A0A381NZS9_9ZZZZ